jgi:hypothetical protein
MHDRLWPFWDTWVARSATSVDNFCVANIISPSANVSAMIFGVHHASESTDGSTPSPSGSSGYPATGFTRLVRLSCDGMFLIAEQQTTPMATPYTKCHPRHAVNATPVKETYLERTFSIFRWIGSLCSSVLF